MNVIRLAAGVGARGRGGGAGGAGGVGVVHAGPSLLALQLIGCIMFAFSVVIIIMVREERGWGLGMRALVGIVGGVSRAPRLGFWFFSFVPFSPPKKKKTKKKKEKGIFFFLLGGKGGSVPDDFVDHHCDNESNIEKRENQKRKSNCVRASERHSVKGTVEGRKKERKFCSGPSHCVLHSGR